MYGSYLQTMGNGSTPKPLPSARVVTEKNREPFHAAVGMFDISASSMTTPFFLALG